MFYWPPATVNFNSNLYCPYLFREATKKPREAGPTVTTPGIIISTFISHPFPQLTCTNSAVSGQIKITEPLPPPIGQPASHWDARTKRINDPWSVHADRPFMCFTHTGGVGGGGGGHEPHSLVIFADTTVTTTTRRSCWQPLNLTTCWPFEDTRTHTFCGPIFPFHHPLTPTVHATDHWDFFPHRHSNQWNQELVDHPQL